MRNRPGCSVIDGLGTPTMTQEPDGKLTATKNSRAYSHLIQNPQQQQQFQQPISNSNFQVQQSHSQNQNQQNRYIPGAFNNQPPSQVPHYLPQRQFGRNPQAGNFQIDRQTSNSSRMSLSGQIRTPSLSVAKASNPQDINISMLNASSNSRNTINSSSQSHRNTPSRVAPLNIQPFPGNSGNQGSISSGSGGLGTVQLLIQTTNEDNRPFSGNTFTSSSATNSNSTIPFLGAKNSLMSSLHRGVITAKSGSYNQPHDFLQFSQQTTAGTVGGQVSPNGGQFVGQVCYSGVSRNSLGTSQSVDKNNKPYEFSYQNQQQHHQQQKQSQQQASQQQQIRQQAQIQQSQLFMGNQEKNNILQQQIQQPTQLQGIPNSRDEGSPIIRQKGFSQSMSKQQLQQEMGVSMNLKETILALKQQEEQKRLSKSTQGQDFERIISQKGQYLQQEQVQSNENNNLTTLMKDAEENEKIGKQTPKNIGIIKQTDPLPNHEPTKCSFKRNGIVKAYAANTNQGLVRNYNEDRVSIILNIMKPASRAHEQWPKCSFFGVYDGHGGVNCADFLRDNLHQFIIKETSFPWNPKEALRNGFLAAEKAFLELAQSSEDHLDRSGSCAITVLIVGDTCYVANVGDSRAVLSGDSGQKIYTLSRDHKPGDELEQKRIINGGGKIYQTHATQVKPGVGDQKGQAQLVVGPLRVFPGRLSVSRTFGDIEAKEEKFGGNPNVVISEPEIKSFKITDDHDFIVLASDGVYDKMTSKEVIQSVWNTSLNAEQLSENVHKQCSLGVESILRDSLNKRSLDNVTVVMVAFQNYKEKLFGASEKLPLEEIKNYQPSALTSKHEEPSKYALLQQALGSKTATAASSASYMADRFSVNNNDFKNQAMTPNNRSSHGDGQIRKKFKENQIFYPQNGNISQSTSYSNENISFQPNQGSYPGNNSLSLQNNFTVPPSSQQLFPGGNSQSSANTQNHQSQYNKLRILDQRITEFSQKTTQFSTLDRKISVNNR